MEQTYCPVCKFKKTSLKRYPSSICNECIVKYGTKTKDGKKINFSNESIFGGFISQIDQVLLSLLSPSFFLIALILILSIIGLCLGSILFGGYSLSEDYKNSDKFSDRTKSLFLMVSRKFADWAGISIPAFFTSFIFLLILSEFNSK